MKLLKTNDKVEIRNVMQEMQISSSCKGLQAFRISYFVMVEEIVYYIKQTIADKWWLPTKSTELGLFPVDQFTQLEIPVPDFQSMDIFQIHQAHCTETKAFWNAGPRNYLILGSSLKKANGIVLDKAEKPTYNTPASFRIIIFLETVSKILKRIMATRLSALTRFLDLLYPTKLDPSQLKVSTLFLDIKGGFDNVLASLLCNRLATKAVNPYKVL
ncbi:hypothetical protein HOY80DRAFT_1043660 [Tuber brumale]|nr:hypothetical protein HOY80DRAFT_1043660 [Tuber brumale]